LQRKDTRGPQPIADAIRLFLRDNRLRRPGGDERVFSAWIEAAGADWRGSAVPVSFRNGQLVVEVRSSVALAELKNYHAEGYRQQANASLGEALITKVVIKLKG
jgi:hypothetical protein